MRKTANALCFLLALSLPQQILAQIRTEPAPAGNEFLIAYAAITDAGQSCPKLSSANRLKDGSIRALCSNGQAYRISRIRGYAKTVSMSCSAAASMGIGGC